MFVNDLNEIDFKYVLKNINIHKFEVSFVPILNIDKFCNIKYTNPKWQCF